jgi:hypothetical protein
MIAVTITTLVVVDYDRRHRHQPRRRHGDYS